MSYELNIPKETKLFKSFRSFDIALLESRVELRLRHKSRVECLLILSVDKLKELIETLDLGRQRTEDLHIQGEGFANKLSIAVGSYREDWPLFLEIQKNSKPIDCCQVLNEKETEDLAADLRWIMRQHGSEGAFEYPV